MSTHEAGEKGTAAEGEANIPKDHANPTNAGTTDTFTDARGRRYIAGEQVPEEVWQRHEKVLKHETYLMAQVMRKDGDRGRATAGSGADAGEGVEGRRAEPRVPSSLAAAFSRRVADALRGRRRGGETLAVAALHSLHAHWDESGHGTFPGDNCGTCAVLAAAYWSEIGPMPWEHVCDVAGCERGFATMSEVIAHERTHRPWFARRRDRIFGRKNTSHSGREGTR